MDIDEAPIYFTPDTFQLRKEQRLKKAKKLRKAVKKWTKVAKRDSSHIKFRDGVEKCVNFLSSFPAKGKKVTNQNTVSIYSSTESEEGLGFKGVNGSSCLNSATDSDSDESFTIIFSDTKRKQGQKMKPTKAVKKKRACFSQLSTLTSESGSDSSFDICFERGAEDLNDDALSDSDSLTPNCKETEATFSGFKISNNVTKMDDSWSTDFVDKEGVDVCDGIAFSRSHRSPRKKVWFDSGAPKVHTIVAWAHAYRQARIGPWEMCARDGERFRKRIKDTSGCLEWVFGSEHRSRIFFQRFNPLLMEQVKDEAPEFEDEVVI